MSSNILYKVGVLRIGYIHNLQGKCGRDVYRSYMIIRLTKARLHTTAIKAPKKVYPGSAKYFNNCESVTVWSKTISLVVPMVLKFYRDRRQYGTG